MCRVFHSIRNSVDSITLNHILYSNITKIINKWIFDIQVSNPPVVIYCSSLYTKDIKKKEGVHAQIQDYFPVELGPRDIIFVFQGGGSGVRGLFCKKTNKKQTKQNKKNKYKTNKNTHTKKKPVNAKKKKHTI